MCREEWICIVLSLMYRQEWSCTVLYPPRPAAQARVQLYCTVTYVQVGVDLYCTIPDVQAGVQRRHVPAGDGRPCQSHLHGAQVTKRMTLKGQYREIYSSVLTPPFKSILQQRLSLVTNEHVIDLPPWKSGRERTCIAPYDAFDAILSSFNTISRFPVI